MKKLLACVLACTGITLQAQVVTQLFEYTGGVQTFTVPACVNVISFTCLGAQGGRGNNMGGSWTGGSGGLGASVRGTTTVTPGSVIYIYVGGEGWQGGNGGFNGGGNGGFTGSGGGGATDIRIGGNALANRVLVAGGGGGGGNASCSLSGANGGFGGGGNGSPGGTASGAGGGGGGSGVNPGLAGSGCQIGLAGTSGSLGLGGNGGNGAIYCVAIAAGGGGGGGYYGGGGGGGGAAGNSLCQMNVHGSGGAGAGGTNYIDPAFTATSVTNGFQSGNGRVFISFAPSPLSLTVTPVTPTVCLNSTVALNVSGATNYTWSSGSTTFSTSVSPAITTTYTVNGVTTSTLGTCTGTGTISVTVYSLPVVSVNSGSICSGSTFTMTPNGASTYTFQSGSAVVSPTSNTTYTVQGTDALGCRSPFTTASVMVYALPVISVNSGTVCPGTPFTLSPSGASTYTYLNGGPIISPTIAGTYSVSGTSSLGCVSQSPGVASISLFSVPIVSVNSGTMCYGTTFTMIPNGASTYTFQGGSAVVSPTSNATYTVLGTSAQGCNSASFATTSVTVYSLPVISVNSGTVCPGTPFTLTPSGASTYTYLNGGPIVSPTLASSYSVSGTSSLGCVSQSPGVASISLFTVPVVSVNSGTICYGTNFTMTPNGAASYTFQGGSAVVSPTSNATYTVRGTSAQGCNSASFATASVTVVPLPVISVNNGSICYGNNFTMTPNGAASYTFQGGSAVVSPTSNATYTVRGTSAQGCNSASFATASVTVVALPVISVNGGTVCPGSPFTLTPSGASTYTYLNGGPLISPTLAGTYSVNGTSSVGCVSQSPGVASISLFTVPVVSVNSGTLCQGTSFTLSPFGAISYTYVNGGPVVSPSVTSTYSVLGSSAEGCVSASYGLAQVDVLPAPTITVTSGAICRGDVFTLMAQGAVSYTYEGGNPSVSPLTTTSYTVIGTDTLGCESVVPAVSAVTVLPEPSVLIIGATTVCAGESVTLSALGATSYTWSTGSNSTTIVVSPQISTTYSVSGEVPEQLCAGKDTLSVTVFACTALQSIDATLNGLLLYPNPAGNHLTVELPGAGLRHVSVSDATGRKVTELNSSEEKFDLDLSTLSPGLYLVRVNCGGSSATVRIVRQ